MRNTLIFNILLVCAMAASCSEWTTPESLEFEKNSIQQADPELYRQYCEAVREYKKSDHKVMYVTFENVQMAGNGSHKITMLPDSVDYVQLHDLTLAEDILKEMDSMRENLGTGFVARFSYNECLSEYEALKAAEPELPAFEEFLGEEFAEVTAKVAEYGLDGFTFAYTCGNPYEMTSAGRNAIEQEQELVFQMVAEWLDANSDKAFFFEGYPHYILVDGVVDAADYVILPTRSERSTGDLAYMALQAVNSGKISKDIRFIFAVETPSFVEEEYLVGQFVLGEQIPLAADWMTEDASFDKSGLAVWNVQRDYFGTKKIYSNVRRAIKTMNPNE
jgi:hypothetical protein